MTTVRLAAFLLGSLLVAPAFAQQQQPPADPATLHRVINALVQQRNAALDAAALAEARARSTVGGSAEVEGRSVEGWQVM